MADKWPETENPAGSPNVALDEDSFTRFKDVTAALLSVPKEEIVTKEEERANSKE